MLNEYYRGNNNNNYYNYNNNNNDFFKEPPPPESLIIETIVKLYIRAGDRAIGISSLLKLIDTTKRK